MDKPDLPGRREPEFSRLEIRFYAGSQPLYGAETIAQVEANARTLVLGLTDSGKPLPLKLTFCGVLTDAESIRRACLKADAEDTCAGLVFWMHTFSPAQMWISGLTALSKPFVHLHTQYAVELPWDAIDMDYMNLHQAAHGDREFGYLCTRLCLPRTVIAGHWRDPSVHEALSVWMRAAAGKNALSVMRIARFGDNMRDVAVTEGDKVEARIRMGVTVQGFGTGDLVTSMEAVKEREIAECLREYEGRYDLAAALLPSGKARQSLVEAARIELGLRAFLSEGGFHGFTTTFENLHGLPQLPGLAVQRLMADGYGFGAEGDWKTAVLLRTLKVMAQGLSGGASFMEDYTYDLTPGHERVLGAHMLEVCPSLTTGRPRLEVHPLSIGNRKDPVRLVFAADPGPAVNVSLIDLGHRFRMIVNTCDLLPPERPLPRLPVAYAIWAPHPDWKTAVTAWLYAGGAHHTALSRTLNVSHLTTLCAMLSMECIVIDRAFRLHNLNSADWHNTIKQE